MKFWVETKVEENQEKIDYWLSKLTQSKNAVIVVEEEEEAKVEEHNEDQAENEKGARHEAQEISCIIFLHRNPRDRPINIKSRPKINQKSQILPAKRRPLGRPDAFCARRRGTLLIMETRERRKRRQARGAEGVIRCI